MVLISAHKWIARFIDDDILTAIQERGLQRSEPLISGRNPLSILQSSVSRKFSIKRHRCGLHAPSRYCHDEKSVREITNSPNLPTVSPRFSFRICSHYSQPRSYLGRSHNRRKMCVPPDNRPEYAIRDHRVTLVKASPPRRNVLAQSSLPRPRNSSRWPKQGNSLAKDRTEPRSFVPRRNRLPRSIRR